MSARIDLTGQVFNHLTVVGPDPAKRWGIWMCSCDCGGSTSVSSSNLKTGSVKACGCLAPRKAELRGQQFGRLSIQKFLRMQKGKSIWQARCGCGTVIEAVAGELLRGATKSCGCLARELISDFRTSHGMTKSATYASWSAMHSRTSDTESTGYQNYGGRGISVCPEWSNFEIFLSDMGERPEGRSLDRKDTDKGYSKTNCQWSTPRQQANNRRKNRRYIFDGLSTTCAQLTRIWGLSWYKTDQRAAATLKFDPPNSGVPRRPTEQ
jgi:hypothetical protein